MKLRYCLPTLRAAWILGLGLLAACAPRTISSYRAPGLDIAPQGLRVVYEESSLTTTTATTITDTSLNQVRLILGNNVVERVPPILERNGLRASAKSLPSAAIPPSRDFGPLFPPEQAGWHTLVITPTAASVVCYNGCSTYFRVAMRLIDPATRRIVWSATVDQPRLSLALTRMQMLENFADELAGVTLKTIGKAESADAKRAMELANTAPGIVPEWQRERLSRKATGSGYAEVTDVNAVPFLDERGRKGYEEWLRKPPPKAFAISSTGKWNSTWGASQVAGEPAEPVERAMVRCSRRAPDCGLYAVDGRVVWTPDSVAR